jgi:tetratricopeptide (TPR) repeat protein
MRRHIHVIGLVAIAFASLWLAWAGAGRAEAQGDKRALAEKFFRAGEQAYKAGQYVAAAQAFEEAYKLLPLPAIAFSTAQAHRLQYFIDKESGRLERAIELYRVYIEQVPAGGRRDDATSNLAELEPIRLRLTEQGKMNTASAPEKPATQLMITSQVSGARATIDGQGGEVPLIREVEPGAHRVEVSARGYFPETQTATAVEGKFIVVEMALRPRPALLSIATESGAMVSVDGRPMGVTPLPGPLQLDAGKHFISVSKRGRKPWSKEITLARGDQMALQAPLYTTRQRQVSYWVLGTAGATATAAGVATFLALSADRDVADLEDRRTTQGLTLDEFARYRDLREVRDDRRSLALALWGTGGAIAVTGALLYWLDTPRAEIPLPSALVGETAGDTALRLTPTISPEGLALTLSSAF